MTSTLKPSPLAALKAQARRLRAALAAQGHAIGHGQALELLARQLGHKDWNVLHAAIGNRPPAAPVALGDRVSGRYLGQAFDGDVIGVQALSSQDRFRITLNFDEAVDVVEFESFSAYRKRVTCTIDRTGRTAEKTSNGRPHLHLQL